jgi:hypothetical protein
VRAPVTGHPPANDGTHSLEAPVRHPLEAQGSERRVVRTRSDQGCVARRLPEAPKGFEPGRWGQPAGRSLAGSAACIVGRGVRLGARAGEGVDARARYAPHRARPGLKPAGGSWRRLACDAGASSWQVRRPPTLRLRCPPQREGCWGEPHPKSEPHSERWIDPGDDQDTPPTAEHRRTGDFDCDQLGQRVTPSRTAR